MFYSIFKLRFLYIEIDLIINNIYQNIGSATGPHGHDPGLISRDDDKKALSGKNIIL